MIETTQAVEIDAPLGAVWAHARDVRRWAEIMPGYRECEIVDDDHSRWVLKVGVGGLVRTVKVKVTVDRWAGPEAVDFSYQLEGDPVSGSGTYRAEPAGANRTRLALHVRVVGAGPMAPMWEAMGGPLLPRFAAGFAGQLKAAIEAELPEGAPASTVAPVRRGLLGRLAEWLRRRFARQ